MFLFSKLLFLVHWSRLYSFTHSIQPSLAWVNTKQYGSPLILDLVALLTGSLFYIVLSVDQKTQAFKEVVITKHPRLGEYAIGFITSTLVLQVHIYTNHNLKKSYIICAFIIIV